MGGNTDFDRRMERYLSCPVVSEIQLQAELGKDVCTSNSGENNAVCPPTRMESYRN